MQHDQAVVNSEMPVLNVAARGYIGDLGWALCNKGSGFELMIGSKRIEIHTSEEIRGARELAEALRTVLLAESLQ